MQVSSGTISLFVCVAMAMVGAASTAYILEHPEETHGISGKLLKIAGIDPDRLAAVVAPRAPGETSIQVATTPPDTVTLNADQMGHFEADAEVNGRRVSVLVDTGATLVALTYEDAGRAGIFPRPSDFTQVVATANGTARYAPVTIDSVTIGDITVHNIQGAISEPGRLHRTLLGMSFLGRLSRVDMRTGTLVLHE